MRTAMRCSSPRVTRGQLRGESGAQYDRVAGFSEVRFERMRQGRDASQYFDPDRPEKTDDDARWALDLAEEALAAVGDLLESGRLDLY
jgi:hypothetical protein